MKKEDRGGGGAVTGFKVEQGIELPPKPEPGRRAYKYPWDEMKVGDSFFVPAEEGRARKMGQQIIGGGHTRARRQNQRRVFTFRQVEGGVRIWRVQ